MDNTTIQNNDTIDLRELVQILVKRKKLILLLTLLFVLLAGIYAYFSKPVYQVKAVIEIGKMNAGTKNETPLDNIGDVKQKLEHLYGVKSKNKRKYPRVKAISVAKRSESIFSIVVEGRDNKSALQRIDEVVHKVENVYAQKIKTYIDTQKELITLTNNDILSNKKNLQDITDTLKGYNIKMLNITEQDAALAGLYTIQISQNQTRLQGLEARISALKSKEFNLKLAISPLRITQTKIVGEVEVLDKPVKPKKALIIIVSFITGLMFSTFLVFFLEFLKGQRKE